MTEVAPTVRAVVLAAGAGSRFGGRKLEARFDGRGVLQHVLDALAEAGLDDPIAVVGAEVPRGVDWGRARRVVNLAPEQGLASSLRIGWLEAASVPSSEAILIVLGDQALLRPDVVRALAAAPLDPARPIVAPRYRGSDGHNPVRVETAASALIDEAEGDRGLGPVIARHPELVRWLDVDGENLDIDTATDLARVAELAWANRVLGNREQVDRVREVPDGADFYASTSSIFREDPDRTGDPILDVLRAHARPDDTWLDIGAGAGRYALPLARVVRRVIAIDPSASMLAGLREGMAEDGIENIEVIEGRWPAILHSPDPKLAEALPVDVSLIAHVGYDVEAIGEFIEAMERTTRRECIALLMERSPASAAEQFWPPIHGERRIALPALPAFVDLLRARGREPRVEMVESSRRRWASRAEIERFLRRQTWVAPGSAKDARMETLLDEWLVTTPDGSVELSFAEDLRIGLVGWDPA